MNIMGNGKTAIASTETIPDGLAAWVCSPVLYLMLCYYY